MCHLCPMLAGSPDGAGRRERTTGVLAAVGPAEAPIHIRFAAPVVLCACNALNTPCLLLRSGIHCNRQVGAHLQCHPIAFAVGTCPQVSRSLAQGGRHVCGVSEPCACHGATVWEATSLFLQGNRGNAEAVKRKRFTTWLWPPFDSYQINITS